MSYQRDREQFLIQATKEGLPLDICRKLLRYATTLHRIAEAQCNGDYPYNGDRDNYTHATLEDPHGHKWQERQYADCPKCESNCRKSAFRKSVCPDCRTQELVIAALDECPVNGSFITAVFQGDPRGAVLKLSTPNFQYDECGKNGAYGLYVPSR